MASIASVDVHEAVSRSARENEKSYDEALKEFLELFEHSLLNHAWVGANVNKKEDAEVLKDCQVRAAEAYQNANEKYKIEPEGLFDWIANNLVLYEENRNNLEL